MGKNKPSVIYLPKHRRAEISELAEAVLAEFAPEGNIDPVFLAKRNSISLNYGKYIDAFDGLIEQKDGRFHIYLNLDRIELPDSTRCRFTLAHELGHFFLDSHRNALESGQVPSHASFCEYESTELVEQEADWFAANLLMPESRFRKKAKGFVPGFSSVIPLAHTFRTSITSTAIRYVSLGLGSCIAVKWNSEGFAWRWLCERAREAGYRWTIQSDEKIVTDSATHKALRGEPVPEKRFFSTGTTAAYWFPSISTRYWKDIILKEEAMPLGRFGVLTLLYPENGEFPKE